MREVELFHPVWCEVVAGVFQFVNDGLEFFDDVDDCLVVFLGILDHVSKQLCMSLAFKEHNPSVCFDFQLEMCADWVEDGVVGFCGIWDEVVVVEVGDEVVQF